MAEQEVEKDETLGVGTCLFCAGAAICWDSNIECAHDSNCATSLDDNLCCYCHADEEELHVRAPEKHGWKKSSSLHAAPRCAPHFVAIGCATGCPHLANVLIKRLCLAGHAANITFPAQNPQSLDDVVVSYAPAISQAVP